MKNLILKTYTEYKTAVMNEKGSQALEWIGIAAVIVILTGVISTAFNNGDLGDSFRQKFVDFLDNIG